MLTKSWAKSVLIRMGFVKRKGTTTAKVSPENFENLKVGLSDSEIFTITIVERMVFTITNTITMVDLLNISIHNTKN